MSGSATQNAKLAGPAPVQTLTDANELAGLAVEFHRRLRQLDPARWRSTRADEVRDALTVAARDFASRRASSEATNQALSALSEALRTPMPDNNEVASWVDYRSAVAPAYEALVVALKAEGERVQSLRPTNYRRSLGHALSGLFVLAIIELVPVRYLLIPSACAFALVWLTEGTRKISPRWNARVMRLFSPIAHPYEINTINSGTWYVTALFALALLQNQMAAAVAVVTLALADPAAALIGRKFGTVPLVNGRSLQGTATFFLVGAVASLVILSVFHGNVSAAQALCICLAASFAGAIAELFSARVDDNLSIPVVVGAVAYCLALVG